jgi:hypothetical protein
MNKWRVGEDIGSKEMDGYPLTAYLNGELTADEVIYMHQPPGHPAPNSSGKVCQLLKTLYGLKQSGRRWYQKLVHILISKLGFTQYAVNQAVFHQKTGPKLTIITVHINNCTIAATTIDLILGIKREIYKYVEISDLGELHWLLRIEIVRNRDACTIHLSQKSYIDTVIHRFNLEDTRPVFTPMETNVQYTSLQSPKTTREVALMKNVPYHEATGSLMWACLRTRPDIAFAVTTLSHFSKDPGEAHWLAVK